MVDATRAKEVAQDYLSSLADLTINSKPLITMLTILAEENIEFAAEIVDTIEQHIMTVGSEFKLPILYLIDSIVKNVGQQYKTLFNVKIATIFCDVFSKVNEKIREKMYALRQTWNDVFPQKKLYTLDVKVNYIDPGWPITAKLSHSNKSPAIHVNPNFLIKNKNPQVLTEQLQRKQMELLELQKKKLELEKGLNKKTESLRNQKPSTRAHLPGHSPVPVSTLPRIPKKQNDLSEAPRDPRIARQNRDPRSIQKVPSQSMQTNNKSPGPSPTKSKQSSSGKHSSGGSSDRSSQNSNSSSSKSRDRSTKDRSISSGSTNKNGVSGSNSTSPSKRSDRSEKKRQQSSPSRSHKRSREKSPVPENNKAMSNRSKNNSISDGPWANKLERKVVIASEYKDRNPSPQLVGDVDLRMDLRSKGE